MKVADVRSGRSGLDSVVVLPFPRDTSEVAGLNDFMNSMAELIKQQLSIMQRVEQLLEQQLADRTPKTPEAILVDEILESLATRALQTDATTTDGDGED